tara:strand:+ start:210 stop:389 length:180 start_codon:yes stop_codon:yes gene_type:complete
MQLNQNNTDNPKDIVNGKVIAREVIENLNYLYPNGHRITHQMRWFKVSRNRALKDDTAA